MNFIYKVIASSLLTFIFITSAQAGWYCKMHNARGQIFNGYGYTRGDASSHAMYKCSRHSEYARNCVLDFCNRQ
jgi:hypothetical protein